MSKSKVIDMAACTHCLYPSQPNFAGPAVAATANSASGRQRREIPDHELNLTTQSGLYEFIARRHARQRLPVHMTCICGMTCGSCGDGSSYNWLWEHVYNLEGVSKERHIAMASLMRG